ncbi:MAG: sigma-54 dependent transcriptional regulator, partial [Pseudomonadota bacterium]
MSRRRDQTLLIVDAEPSARRLHSDALASSGYTVLQAADETAARTLLENEVCAAIVLDAFNFPGDVEAFILAARERDAGTVIVCVTSDTSMSSAVSAMQMGCANVLAKPASAARLRSAVSEALSAPITAPGAKAAVHASAEVEILGQSAPMREITALAERFAPSTAPVLITGESGTGKEVCAQWLHSRSQRAGGPFVALNCAALPKELMESEIFGHVRGAFTGAASDRVGAARAADGGTLFLDEVGEMDISLQAKLLRFLQTGEVKRVGSDTVAKVDVRIICATNRTLPEEISAGRFREDLYYRLNILTLHLPPLRARGTDVLQLAGHFLEAFASEEGRDAAEFTQGALEALANHSWPGNVRELQNVIRRAVVLSRTGRLTEHDLFPAGAPAQTLAARATVEQLGRLAPPPAEAPLARRLLVAVMRPLADIEREVIEAVITACDGNLRKAADTLQVSPSTLYRKREAWAAEDDSGTVSELHPRL